jgi:hypothetical protein
MAGVALTGHPLALGAPPCGIHSDNPHLDGLDIVLQGGRIDSVHLLSRNDLSSEFFGRLCAAAMRAFSGKGRSSFAGSAGFSPSHSDSKKRVSPSCLGMPRPARTPKTDVGLVSPHSIKKIFVQFQMRCSRVLEKRGEDRT